MLTGKGGSSAINAASDFPPSSLTDRVTTGWPHWPVCVCVCAQCCCCCPAAQPTVSANCTAGRPANSSPPLDVASLALSLPRCPAHVVDADSLLVQARSVRSSVAHTRRRQRDITPWWAGAVEMDGWIAVDCLSAAATIGFCFSLWASLTLLHGCCCWSGISICSSVCPSAVKCELLSLLTASAVDAEVRKEGTRCWGLGSGQAAAPPVSSLCRGSTVVDCTRLEWTAG